MKNIRLVPLDEKGNPIDMDFTEVKNINWAADKEEDLPIMPQWPARYEMEMESVNIAALFAFFTPRPMENDAINLKFGEHEVVGHLTKADRKDDQGRDIWDMLDGRWLCGLHDLEMNHLCAEPLPFHYHGYTTTIPCDRFLGHLDKGEAHNYSAAYIARATELITQQEKEHD